MLPDYVNQKGRELVNAQPKIDDLLTFVWFRCPVLWFRAVMTRLFSIYFEASWYFLMFTLWSIRKISHDIDNKIPLLMY